MLAKGEKIMSKASNGSVKIGEYTEGHLIKTAKKLVAEKTAGATIFDADAEARIPLFEKSGESC